MKYGSRLGCLLTLVVVVMTSVACSTAPPEQIPMTTKLSSEFVGERSVDYVLHWTDEVAVEEGTFVRLMEALGATSTTQDDEREDEVPHHLGIQVCDVVDGGPEHCRETRVLDFILTTPTSSYEPRMVGERRIKNMFWFDSEILYIFYLEYPEEGAKIRSNSQPRMKMCRITDDNSMVCEQQTEFAELLQWTE